MDGASRSVGPVRSVKSDKYQGSQDAVAQAAEFVIVKQVIGGVIDAIRGSVYGITDPVQLARELMAAPS